MGRLVHGMGRAHARAHPGVQLPSHAAVDAPGACPYCPGGHSVGDALPIAHQLPAGHAPSHAASGIPAPPKVPAGHGAGAGETDAATQ